MKKTLILFILTMTTISSMFSTPYTTIGQLRAPDAYVLPHKSAEFTFTSYLRRDRSDFVGLRDYEFVPSGLINIGLFDRVGIALWGGDDLGFADLKLKVFEETPSIPQVAVGVDNLFSRVKENAKDQDYANENWYDNPDKCFYERNSFYLAATKATVLKNLTGLKLLETFITVGIGTNKFKGQVELAKRFEGVFGSITVKPHKDFSITFENDGFNLNIGAQYSYKNLGFKVSYVGLEEQENNRIGIAVSYLFDKFADSRRKQIYDGSYTSRKTDLTDSQILGQDINANSNLLEELKKLKVQREQAQKVLDDLRKQLKEMESDTGNE